MLLWTPWALPGLVAGSLAFLLALFIWRTAREARVRNWMTALLVAEGLGQLTGMCGPMNLLHSENAYGAVWTLHFLNDCALLAIYLPAIASVVPSPLLRPFRTGPGRIILAAFAGVCATLILLAPQSWVGSVEWSNFEGYGSPFAMQFGPVMAAIFFALFCSFMYGLVATALTWRRAPPGVGRRRAGVLTLAFGTRDLTVGGMYITGAVGFALGFDFLAPSTEAITIGSILMGYSGGFMHVVLMSYAIAVFNVIDIDLRIKRGLKQSTVAAAFIALFFVISEGTASLLSDSIGTLAGIAAAGALVFFLAPLQEFAARFANRAMPTVQDTPEYRQFRKLQIYGEAVREASASSGIDAVSRAALNGLRAELGLGSEAALQLEEQLAGAGTA